MLDRRNFLIIASLFALASCASCKANQVHGGGADFGSEGAEDRQARKHACRENIADVLLFSPDERSVSAMSESDVEIAADLISALDSATAENSTITPNGGVTGGRDHMFFVVLSTTDTLSIGTDGKRALYDSVPYESDYDTCQELYSLYAKIGGGRDVSPS